MRSMKITDLIAAVSFGMLCIALAAAFILFPAPAHAAALGASIPYGDAAAQVGDAIKPTVTLALEATIIALLVKYGGPLGMFARQKFVSDLIKSAVDYAFASTFGAVRGKTLTIDASHKVLNQIVFYAEGHFPWVLKHIIGGAKKLVEKAVARMPELPADFQYAHTPQLLQPGVPAPAAS